MVTRQLKIKGNKASELVTSEISINGVQVFSGEIGTGLTTVSFSSQPAESPDLVTVDYNGSPESETIAVEVKITAGTAFIGPMLSAVTDLNTNEVIWLNQSTEDIDAGDGRKDIKLDGVAPAWPTDPSIVSPGGTPDHPAWTGYCFAVPADSVFSCTVDAPAQTIPLDEDTDPV